MPRIRLPNEWIPRDYQMASWQAWERGCKRQLLIWHRRAGKDDVSLHKAAVAAHERIGTYWHMLPEYAQARKAIWNAVNPRTGRRRIDDAFPHELRANTNDHEMFIRFKCGSTWQVVGSDSFDALVGAPPVGLVASEWALGNPSAWGVLAPILVENNGWADFITTPRGRNHVKTMLDMTKHDPAWFSQVLTVDDTGIVTKEQVEQQRREYHAIFGQDAGDALIEQEYYCSFEAAILGSYYGREMLAAENQGRICKVDYDPELPVYTAWDLGVSDSTAIWFFQRLFGRVHVIDYYEADGFGAAHYVEKLAFKGYKYAQDYLPHDARAREFLSTGPDGKAKTRIQVLKEMGRDPRIVSDQKFADGINAGRNLLARCYFDEERCARGLECLRQYRREWDDDKKAFKETHLHDWASHGADAWRYLAVGIGEIKPEPKDDPKPMLGIADMTFDQLIARHAPGRRERV